jgi:hypothetical protein
MKVKKPHNGEGIKTKPKDVSRQQSDTCVDIFMTLTKMSGIAVNIEKQVNTVNDKKRIQDNKKAKNGDFQGTYNTLLSALGGNRSAPECDGIPIDNTTSRSSTYKTTLATLDECEVTINASCGYPINSTFNDYLQECKTLATTLRAYLLICSKKENATAGCICVEALNNVADYSTLIPDCRDVTKPTSVAVVENRNRCNAVFRECKRSQDDSVEAVGTCKKVNKCGGAKNKTEAKRLLKILKPLQAALTNTGFADALKNLGLDTGTGSDGKGWDGKSRMSRLSQLRLARYDANDERNGNSTDGPGCTEIEAEWKNFNTSGDKAVPGVKGDVDEVETNNTITSLNNLNNRATLETDLSSCAKEDSRQVSVTFTIVKIRFYIFWCGWFQIFVVEIKVITLEISFGISSPSPSPTPAPTPAPTPVATSAPGGRHLAKHLIKRAAFKTKTNN